LRKEKTRPAGSTPFREARRASTQVARTIRFFIRVDDYYRRKKKQKKIAGKAKMALASSISDIVYHVLVTGEPYPPRAN